MAVLVNAAVIKSTTGTAAGANAAAVPVGLILIVISMIGTDVFAEAAGGKDIIGLWLREALGLGQAAREATRNNAFAA